jgi:SAM-dependent methyltransferase
MPTEEVALYEAPCLYDAVVPPGPCESFYTRLALRTGGPVLELACGTGRLSVPLAEDGHAVVGLDNSAAMLGAARRKACEAAVEIEFVRGDMRSFDLGREFALVIVSCNSLSHLVTNEELIGSLRRISRHLAPGGLLAFDVVNPRLTDLVRVDRKSTRLGVLESGTDGPAIEELLADDPVSQVRVLQLRVNGRNERRWTEEMRLRTIFPQELSLLLNAAGLELAARFGDFDGNTLTGDSLNQVCIAHRCPEDLGQ